MMRNQSLESVKISLIAAICIAIFSFPCFAQVNQTETISIITYFPTRFGVYKNLRLIPLDKEPDCSGADCAGMMYLNKTGALYIHNGTQWAIMGSGSGSSGSGGSGSSKLKSLSGHGVSPDQCNNPINGEDLCHWDGFWGRYTYVSFPANFFNKTPHVMVAIEEAPDFSRTPCDDNRTDSFMARASEITKDGFFLTSLASPASNVDCPDQEGMRSRAKVGWLAIGE